ncbi:DUF1016 family protein [bacterium]|nr:DUF1016 family protein [bacterium]
MSGLKDFRLFFLIYADREPSIRHSLRAELEVPSEKSHTACGQFEITPQIQQSLSAESLTPFHPSLSWSHYRAIMRVEKPEARDFYEQEAVAQIYNCLGRAGIYVQARSFFAGDGFGMDVQYHSLNDSA